MVVPADSVQNYIKDLIKKGATVSEAMHDTLNFFGISDQTLTRRLKSLGMSKASFRNIVELDGDKIDDTYGITEKVPQYKYKPFKTEFREENDLLTPDTRERILMISDMQVGYLKTPFGYIIDPISESETRQYFEKLKGQLIKEFVMMSGSDIAQIDFYVTLLGDLIDGETIYKGQINFPVQEQLFIATDVIFDLICFLHNFGFKSITIHSVAGNHGKMHFVYSEKSNWDTVIAGFLKKLIEVRAEYDESFKNVTFDFDRAMYQEKQIGNWTFLLHHGNFTKGGFNMVSIEDKLESFKLYDHKDIDAALMAHWHKITIGETFHIPFAINGCIYPSDFVHKVVGKTESLAFGLITVGTEKPIKELKILDLRLDRDKR